MDDVWVAEIRTQVTASERHRIGQATPRPSLIWIEIIDYFLWVNNMRRQQYRQYEDRQDSVLISPASLRV